LRRACYGKEVPLYKKKSVKSLPLGGKVDWPKAKTDEGEASPVLLLPVGRPKPPLCKGRCPAGAEGLKTQCALLPAVAHTKAFPFAAKLVLPQKTGVYLYCVHIFTTKTIERSANIKKTRIFLK